MSNKIIATAQTYERNDLTATGYNVTLYADGSIALEYRSRWQGTRDGTRYRSNPGEVNVDGITGDVDNDAEARLTEWLTTFDPHTDLPCDWHNGNGSFRQTRRGCVVG